MDHRPRHDPRTCTDGGLDELTELVHETGHAIHIAAIRTRPAFADWPDSDAFTEALAELISLDTAEPAWQRRWLPGGAVVAGSVAIRGRYAEIALDAAWALFEIRLHAAPDRRPNDVWTGSTSTWLGIAPHPELSWWAMRGQLVEAPGYMANYAIGAVIAEDLRAAIREDRGDWTDGDPGLVPVGPRARLPVRPRAPDARRPARRPRPATQRGRAAAQVIAGAAG